MNFWLMKSEPDTYSLETLKKEKRTHWEGVRNYQARNFMRDKMKIGDLALFYHSNTKPPGVAGICKVCSKPYPDFFAWDPRSKYFDPRSTPEKPIWMMVDVEYVETFPHYISLNDLKKHPSLTHLMVIKKGMRLSIQPVSENDFKVIYNLGKYL